MTSQAELAALRAEVRRNNIRANTFTPCSPRHRSCSPAHAYLVESYRHERFRQEVQLEKDTGGYAGDIAHAKAKGYKLIDFCDWLKAHKRN